MELVAVESYNHPIDAYLAKGRLEVEGVPVFLANEHHVWMNWSYAQALGGMQLKVSPQHFTDAQKILKMHNQGEYEHLLNEIFLEIDTKNCPNCNANSYVSKFPLHRIFFTLVSLAISVVLLSKRTLHTCQQCNQKWKD
ncbi:putative signal transducing protein [Bathymodiolus azoricus thioautotrophic gill symbiont]|jgi:hypothetical protein|uniref:Uncharacterized protein n=2 Tax=Bathymodiolus azoricus thioautotrophic gill symbiont TaxID=235205 RepID=A0A1H6MTJ3_9GAMM|nr:DUF2007 domain-containing protein [Bathymodiolus azoricus thioautotrophic gill symbiont]CAC9534632.1 hypothetical protein [uncultured Gammaproteobacteria bacterium]CAB5499811.1 hypothetical protein AZO1586R_989 [Bathymodiolus azoricus thioautotrophic gill symbiont]CAC9541708.1 hypothetical protein [uncultured Gammaproteobacteria bacterium]CAC9984265.1 hypothetical protein [uncultured Gammaproteobacteria bacterium]CAC9993392.1 hypothetical protein [uncultured Gammaproteobacteria bacterium]